MPLLARHRPLIARKYDGSPWADRFAGLFIIDLSTRRVEIDLLDTTPPARRA
jgi:hypothetical protein